MLCLSVNTISSCQHYHNMSCLWVLPSLPTLANQGWIRNRGRVGKSTLLEPILIYVIGFKNKYGVISFDELFVYVRRVYKVKEDMIELIYKSSDLNNDDVIARQYS